MDLSQITESVVREALWAIRYDKPLTRNPLVPLDAVPVRLRDERVDESVRTRELMLTRLLEDLVTDALRRYRTAGDGAVADAAPVRAELERMRRDLASCGPQLEA